MKIKEYRFKKDPSQLRYAYTGCTYGCLGETEIPLTEKPGKYPFLGTEEFLVEPTGKEIEVAKVDWMK